MRRRVLLGVAGLALVVAVAGCGGGKSSSGVTTASGGAPAGAAAIPSGAPVLITASTDLASDAWKQALTLARKFPGLQALLDKGKAQLAKKNLDFAKDIEPALGTEAELAWLDFKSRNDFVFALNPKDKTKFDGFLQKASPPPPHADVGDFVVLSPQQSLVDSAKSATSHLSDDASFKDAMGAIPGDDLLRAYISGPAIQTALQAALSKSGGKLGTSGVTLPSNLGKSLKLDWIAAGLAPLSGGVRIDGAVKSGASTQTATYKPSLPSEFAGGALLYVSFAHLDQVLSKALDQAGGSTQQQLSQAEAALGFSIKNDLLPLFAGEAGLAIYPSASGSTPTFTFAIKETDEAKAKDILGKLEKLVQGLSGGSGGLQTVNVPGVGDVTELKSGKTSLFIAVFNGKLALSNSTDGLKALTGGGAKLADDALYKAAADGAGLGDTNGFVYANLKDGLPLLFSYLESKGKKIPAAARDNTAPLQSALIGITADGDILRLHGFVGIK